ncbi:Alpha/Beta hydrolase protein [Apiospora phragmitis]|uniref:Alpha/Beta hydrolase protein n=1 Tax=Apiospora phragmitis TaxID=2905665 RepID=A0ABR1VV96_9PEZI
MPLFTRLLGRIFVGVLGLASLSSAGVLRARITEGVKIDYKEPSICETIPGVKSYSGYLTLPSTRVQPYEQKLFFWFFESRDSPETAPLSLWLLRPLRNFSKSGCSSIGGHYAPAIAKLLQSRAHSHSGALPVTVDTVGIISGFTDWQIQVESFPRFAINNTYGIQAYDLEVAESAAYNWSSPGGCKEQVERCRALTPNSYRDQFGTNSTVMEVCGGASIWCWNNVYGAYDALSGRDPFDIGRLTPNSIAPPYFYGFLAQEWVLKALGAEVNYTQNNNPTASGKFNNITLYSVSEGFLAAGDFAFDGFREDLGSLLDDGVKVALIHGDLDFRCNWVGGETVSLAIDYEDKHDFAAAGYAPVSTNESYVGGSVRQYGGFSFSRVFQAGHAIGYYQPETAYQIFTRTILGPSSVDQDSDYATEGPSSVFDVKNEPPAQSASECYVYSNPLRLTCTEEQIAALLEGTAVVKNNVMVSPAGRPASA